MSHNIYIKYTYFFKFHDEKPHYSQLIIFIERVKHCQKRNSEQITVILFLHRNTLTLYCSQPIRVEKFFHVIVYIINRYLVIVRFLAQFETSLDSCVFQRVKILITLRVRTILGSLIKTYSCKLMSD